MSQISARKGVFWLTLVRGVMGAVAFVKGNQALARNQLNLGAWFGYQEVLYLRTR